MKATTPSSSRMSRRISKRSSLDILNRGAHMGSPTTSQSSAIQRMRQKYARSKFRQLPSFVRKVVVGVIGTTIILIGIALIFLPGPGVLVIAIGLGVLASEFVWARRVVSRGRLFVRIIGRRVKSKVAK
jgi:tellurite resistance protein TerC